MRILAIDPGNTHSGYALIDAATRSPLIVAKVPNAELLRICYGYGAPDLALNDIVAIEMVASYGMAVGKEVFETCVWIGRFREAVDSEWRDVDLIYRRDVKLHHCNSAKAKDANITQALVDRFAPGEPNRGKGTKAAPGWFHGFAADMWQAYALAVLVADRLDPIRGGVMTSEHVVSAQPPEKGQTMTQPESSPLPKNAPVCGSMPRGGCYHPDGPEHGGPCVKTPPANVPGVVPARVARYAEAIVPHTSDGYDVDDDPTGCWCKERLDGHRWSDHLAEVVVAVADAELAELRAEVEQLRRGGRELGRMVVRHGEMVLQATGLHDWIDEDGDGDWAAVWENLAELRPRAEAAEAEVGQLREALRIGIELDNHHNAAVCPYCKPRRGSAEAKVAAVEQAIERRSKLHARWNGVQELVVTVEDLQAALAGASPDDGGLDERDDPRQRADDEAGDVMEWLDREGGE